jgi:hypothetical protein
MPNTKTDTSRGRLGSADRVTPGEYRAGWTPDHIRRRDGGGLRAGVGRRHAFRNSLRPDARLGTYSLIRQSQPSNLACEVVGHDRRQSVWALVAKAAEATCKAEHDEM